MFGVEAHDVGGDVNRYEDVGDVGDRAPQLHWEACVAVVRPDDVLDSDDTAVAGDAAGSGKLGRELRLKLSMDIRCRRSGLGDCCGDCCFSCHGVLSSVGEVGCDRTWGWLRDWELASELDLDKDDDLRHQVPFFSEGATETASSSSGMPTAARGMDDMGRGFG